jgi:hypothetical protein
MNTTRNTSYKVHVQRETDAEINAVNIEQGAMMVSDTGLYMGYNGENVRIYPQSGVGSGLGWVRYQDSQYTAGSPLSLSDETPVTLPNNGNIKTKSDPTQEYYNTATQKIIGSVINDVYIITVEFKSATPNTQNCHLDLWFENGGGLFENLNVSLAYYKGNATTQTFHNTFQYYITQDFIDNGTNIRIQSHGNSATVWDIQYFIQKTQSYA